MIVLSKYNHKFLALSWNWLNDEKIKSLTNTPDYTKEQQNEWFNKIDSIKGYQIWGILYGDKPIGACGLKNITDTDCEYWGYIGEKDYWGKGVGNVIMGLMIDKALSLGLNSIWLKVKIDNYPAINLYKKFDFIDERKNDNLIYMRRQL